MQHILHYVIERKKNHLKEMWLIWLQKCKGIRTLASRTWIVSILFSIICFFLSNSKAERRQVGCAVSIGTFLSTITCVPLAHADPAKQNKTHGKMFLIWSWVRLGHSYLDLSYEGLILLLHDGEVHRQCDIEQRVVIVDICHHNTHRGSGGLDRHTDTHTHTSLTRTDVEKC